MCVTLIGWKRIHFWKFLPPLLLKIRRSPLFREHCTPNAPFLCSSTNPSLICRWPKDGKKPFIPSECFSRTCYETNTETITTSNQRQRSYHKGPIKIKIKKEGNCLKRGNRRMIRAQHKTKKKVFFLAPQLNIFNRPLLHISYSSVPKYCERRITWGKYRFPKHLSCEEKGRMFCWILYEYYTWCRGMSHVPCASILLPWGRQHIRTQFEYKRAEVTYNGLQALPFNWAENGKWLFGGILRVLVV